MGFAARSTEGAARAAIEPDWGPVLQEAGLDCGLKPAAPPGRSIDSDPKVAWTRSGARNGRVEAAAYHGRESSTPPRAATAVAESRSAANDSTRVPVGDACTGVVLALACHRSGPC